MDGYVDLLRRLRTETDHVVYAPAFDRSRELAVAGAIAVRPEHRLVVTEGNYLLLRRPGLDRRAAAARRGPGSWRATSELRLTRLVRAARVARHDRPTRPTGGRPCPTRPTPTWSPAPAGPPTCSWTSTDAAGPPARWRNHAPAQRQDPQRPRRPGGRPDVRPRRGAHRHRALRRRRLPPRAPGDVRRRADERRAAAWTGASRGVGVLPGDRRMHEVLHAQDCLYTLVVKDADGTHATRG